MPWFQCGWFITGSSMTWAVCLLLSQRRYGSGFHDLWSTSAFALTPNSDCSNCCASQSASAQNLNTPEGVLIMTNDMTLFLVIGRRWIKRIYPNCCCTSCQCQSLVLHFGLSFRKIQLVEYRCYSNLNLCMVVLKYHDLHELVIILLNFVIVLSAH